MNRKKINTTHLIVRSSSSIAWISEDHRYHDIKHPLSRSNPSITSTLQKALGQIKGKEKNQELFLYLPCNHGNIHTLALPQKKEFSHCPESAYSQIISTCLSYQRQHYRIYSWEKSLLKELCKLCSKQGFLLKQLLCWPILLINQQLQDKKKAAVLIGSDNRLLLHYKKNTDHHTYLINRSSIDKHALLTLIAHTVRHQNPFNESLPLFFLFDSKSDQEKAPLLFLNQGLTAFPITWDPRQWDFSC